MNTLYEYDLYYPLTQQSGERSPEATFDTTKKQLTEFFGGLTDFRHRSEGAWKFGGVTYRDEIILLRMLASDRQAAREFLTKMQSELESSLGEEHILIIEREVRSLL